MIYTYISLLWPCIYHIPCNIPLWPIHHMIYTYFWPRIHTKNKFPTLYLCVCVKCSRDVYMTFKPAQRRSHNSMTWWAVKTEPDSMPLIESKWPNPLEWKKTVKDVALKLHEMGYTFLFGKGAAAAFEFQKGGHCFLWGDHEMVLLVYISIGCPDLLGSINDKWRHNLLFWSIYNV